jgi:hypothetical protein
VAAVAVQADAVMLPAVREDAGVLPATREDVAALLVVQMDAAAAGQAAPEALQDKAVRAPPEAETAAHPAVPGVKVNKAMESSHSEGL